MHPQALISFVLINTILAVLLMVPRNIALGQHKDILTLADASQCGLRNHLIVFNISLFRRCVKDERNVSSRIAIV